MVSFELHIPCLSSAVTVDFPLFYSDLFRRRFFNHVCQFQYVQWPLIDLIARFLKSCFLLLYLICLTCRIAWTTSGDIDRPHTLRVLREVPPPGTWRICWLQTRCLCCMWSQKCLWAFIGDHLLKFRHRYLGNWRYAKRKNTLHHQLWWLFTRILIRLWPHSSLFTPALKAYFKKKTEGGCSSSG